jgi:hypothetical protein
MCELCNCEGTLLARLSVSVKHFPTLFMHYYDPASVADGIRRFFDPWIRIQDMFFRILDPLPIFLSTRIRNTEARPKVDSTNPKFQKKEKLEMYRNYGM